MTKLQTVHINAALWRSSKERAKADRLSPEGWLEQQLAHTTAPGSSPFAGSAGQDSEALYNRILQYFKELALTPDQAQAFAVAIQHTIATGEPQTILFAQERNQRYAFNRRLLAVCMSLGDSRIRLPLRAAERLADALHSGDTALQARAIAALVEFGHDCHVNRRAERITGPLWRARS